MPDIQEPQTPTGSIIDSGALEQLHVFLKSDLTKFGNLVKEAGIKAGG